MSMSSSEIESQEVPVPVKSFSYRDMGAPVPFQVNETKLAGDRARTGAPTPGAAGRVTAGGEGTAECCPRRGRGPDRSTPQDGI